MTQKILIINALIVALGLSLMGYWYFIDGALRPPLEFYVDTQNFETDRTVYNPGDTVSVYTNFCKLREGSGTIAWTLVDTVKFFYPEKTANTKPGCYEGWVYIATLPKIGVDGVYHLESNNTVKINPLTSVQYTLKTENFIIEPNE